MGSTYWFAHYPHPSDMKPVELNRILETDDGIFNVDWEKDRPKYADIKCEWKVLGGGGTTDNKLGKYWCVECGMVLCEKHRKNHDQSQQHLRRMRKFDLPSYKYRVEKELI